MILASYLIGYNSLLLTTGIIHLSSHFYILEHVDINEIEGFLSTCFICFGVTESSTLILFGGGELGATLIFIIYNL